MSLLGQSLQMNGARDESALPLIATEVLRRDAVYWRRYSCEAAGLGWAERNALCPGSSDIDLFRYGKGVIDLYAEVTHSALDLGVAEQQLDGTKIAGPAIDQRGLGSA
jgi:hypothetical protein